MEDWNIVKTLFDTKLDLVRHQIDSFNTFIEEDLQNIINDVGNIKLLIQTVLNFVMYI